MTGVPSGRRCVSLNVTGNVSTRARVQAAAVASLCRMANVSSESVPVSSRPRARSAQTSAKRLASSGSAARSKVRSMTAASTPLSASLVSWPLRKSVYNRVTPGRTVSHAPFPRAAWSSFRQPPAKSSACKSTMYPASAATVAKTSPSAASGRLLSSWKHCAPASRTVPGSASAPSTRPRTPSTSTRALHAGLFSTAAMHERRALSGYGNSYRASRPSRASRFLQCLFHSRGVASYVESFANTSARRERSHAAAS
mmetsp:Transcript_12522/g.50335  ORF Transcript_12522/g.50335 Transcript_12522/m.50335 type:complete len:255 (+) Transcript_12522:639-1403(+)